MQLIDIFTTQNIMQLTARFGRFQLTRVSDPHFFADPDPGKNLDANPDPGGIRGWG